METRKRRKKKEKNSAKMKILGFFPRLEKNHEIGKSSKTNQVRFSAFQN